MFSLKKKFVKVQFYKKREKISFNQPVISLSICAASDKFMICKLNIRKVFSFYPIYTRYFTLSTNAVGIAGTLIHYGGKCTWRHG